ncbi:MAG: polyphosphate polymerase domain-containing protein [Chloroflexota bacterium]
MDKVALLNRFDTKYLLAASELLALLPSLADEYDVLEVDGRRAHRYRTLYFDTPEFDLYQRHHQDLAERHKVRSRQYLDSDLAFFEIKSKTTHGQTLKDRLPTDHALVELTPEARALLTDRLPEDERQLEPKLWNDFVRITLVGKQRAERLTLDLGIQFDYEGRTAILPGVAICELKQGSAGQTSAFARRMEQLGVEPTSISKYCAGVALLVPTAPQETYQEKLREIERVARGA